MSGYKVRRWTIEHNPMAHWQWIGKIYYYDASRWFPRDEWWQHVEGHTREDVTRKIADKVAHIEENKWTVVEEHILRGDY